MKVLPFTSEEDFNKNEHEIAKLQKYQHPNVVRLVEVIEGDAAHYVVLELCSCSLADRDFGGVVGVGTQKTSNSAECGTMQFWGPEMFVVGGNGVLGSQAGDMWAFGLIVLELLTGESWICGTNAVEIASSVGGFDVNPQERLSSAELIRSGRLRSILGEETPLSQFIQEEMDRSKRTVQQLQTQLSDCKHKVETQASTIAKQASTITTQATTIAELTKKLGEFVAMEKRLIDKPSTTHSKVVAVEAQVTEAAKAVKWIRGIVNPENAITVWDPTHFRKEGRRITMFGVIDSSQLEQSKTSGLYYREGASVFYLNGGHVCQNGKEIAHGNQEPDDNSVVTIELDMNRHTLVLFVDGQRQPNSLANIPKKVRFVLYLFYQDRYADIVSFDEVSAQK
ncbi:hypothetical protein BLNAU_21260 [Blattamonas nauphoetae]|uniref:Protein kinase domain-containing protein n=1 Tax=Blattamonas nauphoetae TaxID=2049346 RepID=A0ABQ9WWF2_9EUKA|nr:hypothetical protein BLNAU_21260 [Blattamonas nauphoetae]